MTKILSIVVLFLLALSALAEEYRSIDDYINNYKTGNKLSDFKYNYSSESIYDDINESYSKKIENDNKYVLGLLHSTINEQAFIFVLHKKNGIYQEAFRSKYFDMSNMESVQKISINSENKFQILVVNSRSFSSSLSRVFTIQLIQDKWRLTGLRNTSYGSCNEEFLPLDSHSINFISGKIIVDVYKGCWLKKEKKYNRKFPKFYLLDFDLNDERYDIN
jgi:hypothetical protein